MFERKLIKGNFPKKMKAYISSLAILIGTIIGAGIFGLPYVISKSGVLPGFLYFLILGGAALLLHLIFGEIVLRTDGRYRIIGYTKKYLGNKAKAVMAISTIVGFSGSLLAYGILGGNFLKIIFSFFPAQNFGFSSFILTVIFFLFLSFFVFKGVKTVASAEVVTNAVFFLIIISVFIFGAFRFSFDNLSLVGQGAGNMFLPFGVIMFSLIGWMAIPEICDILKTKNEKRSLKGAIIASTIFCILVYIVFSFFVFGVSGGKTSEDALSGLASLLGRNIMIFLAAAAVITLADSFLAIGLALRNTLVFDLGFGKNLASFITCFFPLAFFLAGIGSFIGVIGFAGTVLGAVDGVIIILMYQRAKSLSDRNPEYSLNVPKFLTYALMAVFIAGAFFQIFI